MQGSQTFICTVKFYFLGRQEHLIEKLYPKCYFADEKMIVLENLALDKGFAILDRDGHQDFETAKYLCY